MSESRGCEGVVSETLSLALKGTRGIGGGAAERIIDARISRCLTRVALPVVCHLLHVRESKSHDVLAHDALFAARARLRAVYGNYQCRIF